MVESRKHKATETPDEDERRKAAKRPEDWDRIARDRENMHAGRSYKESMLQEVESTVSRVEGESDSTCSQERALEGR